MPFSQANSPLRFTSTLGDDVLLLESFSGEEGMSMPFRYVVDLLSTDASIDGMALLRTAASITIVLSDGSERVIHGEISRFVQLGRDEGLTSYRAELVPRITFLAHSTDCRIFQAKSVTEIVEAVLTEQGVTDFELQTTKTYEPREYCVQYRESHLNFVSRLMEEEGLFYFFRHTDSAHTLVISDSNSSVEYGLGPQSVAVGMTSGGSTEPDVVLEVEREVAVCPGAVTLRDFNWQTAASGPMESTVGGGELEVYDFPGGFAAHADGDRYARMRLDALELNGEVVRGTSNARAFASGTRFDLTGHYRRDANQTYQILHLRQFGRAGGYRSQAAAGAQGFEYRNEFTAVPHSLTFLPPLHAVKPVVRGTQTAVVVTKSGEEIWVDKHGRVKVQFHWDREGQKDENSSCWVRVSTTWAGKGWGFIQLPRKDQEVIVDFLEGDPDQPIIVGRVYNSDQVPPYALPANQTQSGGKSRSSKQGGEANFNELRFEDKKGEEQIVLHAEKDLLGTVENDETWDVGHDRTTTIKNADTKTIKEADETTTIEKGNQFLTITEGKQTVDIKADQSITIQQGNRDVTVKTGNETVTIETGNQTVAIKQGNQAVTLDTGNQDVQLKMGNQSLSVDMGNQSTTIKMGNQTTKVNLGKISFEAMQEIELKVGQSSVKIDQMGVTIKGMMVKVEGQIQTEVKGLMMQVSGDAMTMVKGGITMIN